MAQTVRGLLTQALYNSSVLDREFTRQDPDDSQINMGLDYLIQVLDSYRDLVPYYSETELTYDKLTSTSFYSISYVQYLLGNVPVTLKQRQQINFGEARPLIGLKTIPSEFYFEKNTQTIKVYPEPFDGNSAKFVIGYRPDISVTTINQALPDSIRSFMALFLQFEVALLIASEKNMPQSKITLLSQQSQKYLNQCKENKEVNIQKTPKTRLKGASSSNKVPWLAYLSGNTP